MTTSINAAGIKVGDTIIADRHNDNMDARVIGFYTAGSVIRIYAFQGRDPIQRMFSYELGEGIRINRNETS